MAHGNAKHIGNHLGKHGPVALPLRRGRHLHRDRAHRVEGDAGGRLGPVLRPGLAAVGGCEDGSDVAHVRHAGLDGGCVADPIEPAFRAGRVPAALELVQGAVADCSVQSPPIIPGIVDGTGRGAVRKGVGRDQVAADHVERIKAELDCDAVHQPLEGVIDLGSSEAPH